MFKKIISFSLGIFLAIFMQASAFACTEIHFNTPYGMISARTMDWYTPTWYVVMNPRGLKHDAWIAQYGSVTVGISPQTSQEGMNEKGLTAGVLWLDKTQYPTKDSRFALGAGLWTQYILDHFATVNEVIADAPKIRVMPQQYEKMRIDVHLIVSDPSGNMAVLEYINGNLVIHQGNPLSIPVLTNNTYENSLTYLKNYQGFGGKLPIPTGYHSKDRFIRAAYFWQQHQHPKNLQQAISHAFNALNDVSEPIVTQHNTEAENAKANSISMTNEFSRVSTNRPEYFGLSARRQGESSRSVCAIHDCCERRCQQSRKAKDEGYTPTQWMIVRDATHKILEFKSVDNPNVLTIHLNQINFDKIKKMKILLVTGQTKELEKDKREKGKGNSS